MEKFDIETPDHQSETNQEPLLCRMYPNPLPEVGSTVVGVVVLLEESTAVVELPEYGELEAMIQYSELSQKRIKALRSHIQQDKLDVFEVIRVDPEKEYIDLSKKFITDADRERVMEKFAHSKAIHSMVRQLAVTQHMTMLEVYEKAIWPLYGKEERERNEDSSSDPYRRMEEALERGTFRSLFDRHVLSEQFLSLLEKFARQRFRKQAIEAHTRIELVCFGPDGIDAIVAALREAKSIGRAANVPISATVVASPEYALRVTHDDAQTAKALLEKAIQAVGVRISNHSGGSMKVLRAPVVGQPLASPTDPTEPTGSTVWKGQDEKTVPSDSIED